MSLNKLAKKSKSQAKDLQDGIQKSKNLIMKENPFHF